MDVVKTTKKDFELFKKECRKWIKFFGISDWDITFKHENLGDMVACCSANDEARWANLKLHTSWESSIYSKQQIRESAFHEVCELLLMELSILADQRFVTKSNLEAVRHGVIQRLSNSIFKEGKHG